VCRDAILTNLLNPKVILLFIAVMPGFVVPGPTSIPVQLALLGTSIILLNIIWQSALVLAAGQARRWLSQPRVQRGIADLGPGVYCFCRPAGGGICRHTWLSYSPPAVL
jgi:threonine/homoserine/homoserine lactone efflux protein